jgi:hypothetical protein
MKYSQLEVKTAIDDANDLLARGSDYEIICAFTYDRVSIQSRVKSTDRLSLIFEHRTVDEAFCFMQGLNTVAMAQLENRSDTGNHKTVSPSDGGLSSSNMIMNKIKKWFK